MTPDYILQKIKGKKIVILGFGKEGISTYRFIRKHFPKMHLTVADGNEHLKTDEFTDSKLSFVTGTNYLQGLNEFDLIFKTPGISFNQVNYFVETERITSQTNLFLEAYHQQVIGVTGTKGKSTTSSLIYHILHNAKKDVILAGNIGIPFFDIIEQMTPDTLVVAELSAHQLEFTQCSPDYAVLLNLYQEHLDHFDSFSNYQLAKMNITKFQQYENFFVYNGDDEHIPALMKQFGYNRDRCIFGTRPYNGLYACCDDGIVHFTLNGEVVDEYDLRYHSNLPGKHNYYNIMAAIAICRKIGLSHDIIMQGLETFKGLPNRIEYVGKFDGIAFYNDSISTIPEATIAAVRALRHVDTLIIGGYDRGIDYSTLIDFLHDNPISNIVFTGPAGQRIMKEWDEKNDLPQSILFENDFQKIVEFCFDKTTENKIVLLSPAAASYDQFKNFEERGRIFKQLIKEHINHP